MEQQEPLTAHPSWKPQSSNWTEKYLGARAFLHASSSPCSFPWIQALQHLHRGTLPKAGWVCFLLAPSHPTRIHPSREGGREGG